MLRIIALFALSANLAFASSDSTVSIDGRYSGVVVSPSGLLLTADHCGLSRQVTVKFNNGQTRTAKLIYAPPQNGVDESQLYQILGGGEFPFVTIAESDPKVGDSVTSAGFPGNKYLEKSGLVTGVNFSVAKNPQFQYSLHNGVVTDWKSGEGASGGPLLNNQGHLIGLLSMSGQQELSYWIGLESIRQSIVAASYPSREQRTIMFSDPSNPECIKFEDEIRSKRHDIVVVRITDPQFELMRTEYKKYTGSELVKFPTFWLESTNSSKQVATFAIGAIPLIVKALKFIVHGIARLIAGHPDDEPEQYVAPLPVEESLEPGNLTIVVLAKKQDLGLAKGAVTSIALNKAIGPLTRKINETIGAQAKVEIIAERMEPERFLIVKTAAQVDADPGAIIVLVRSQSLGLKSIIARKVEESVKGHIPENVPIEIVFERIHTQSYNSIFDALLSKGHLDPAPVPVESDLSDKIRDIATGQIDGILSDKLAGSESKIEGLLNDKLKPAEGSPISNGMIAGLVSALGLGYGSREGWKAFAARKVKDVAVKVVKKKLS
jgi:hypothetical protein